MTILTAPSLDDVSRMSAPAWLWDAARMRIVWANPAGVAYFGCDSLFDLIDLPFEEADPGVARVHELASAVRRGEGWQEMIEFASAEHEGLLSVSIHVHVLADGRNGLLLIGDQQSQDDWPADAAGMSAGSAHELLESLPVATLLCKEDGHISYANPASRQLMGEPMPTSISETVEEGKLDELLRRARKAGLSRMSLQLKTGYGTRLIRCTVKPIGVSNDFSMVLEDLTDRHALQQGLAPAIAPESNRPDAIPAAEQVQKPSHKTMANIKQAIETAVVKTRPNARTGSNAPALGTAPEINPAPKPAGGFDVAEIVRRALSRLERPIVLYRAGRLIYANQSAASALGYKDEDDMSGRHDIASALGTLARSSGRIIVQTRDGTDMELRADKSTFPWNDGAIPMAVLEKTEGAIKHTSAHNLERAIGKSPSTGAGENHYHADAPETSYAFGAGADPAPANAGNADFDVVARQDLSQQPHLTMHSLLSVLDTASDGIVFLSDKGDITHMSAGAQALFGVHAASVIDKPLAELFDDKSAKVLRDYVAALGNSGLTTVFNGGREVSASMKDGGEVPLFITMRRFNEPVEGLPASAYCAVLRDITQWKKTEDSLRKARDSAENSSKQKSEFLARISHELRTPLNAILGFSDVMRKGQFGKLGSERYEGYANDIHTSGQYLLSLVNDLLDLAKVEAGKLELNFISVDLGQAIDASIRLMQDEATAARVVLRKSISPDLPHVVADARSIKQVLLNLIGNAIKFTDPGGQVIISAKSAKNGGLVLSVTDTGVGMNEQQLTRAMEPFHRIEIAGRAEVQGTGLGLPLTKALVEANRAHFSIASEPRKGTKVEITFPTTRVLAG